MFNFSLMQPSTFLKKASLLMLLKLLAAAATLFFHYLLAQQLSAEQFGLFSLASSCVLFSVTFAKQGLEQVSIRFIAKSDSQHFAKLYWLLISYAFISAVITATVVFLLIQFFGKSLFNQPLLIPFSYFVALLTLIQTLLAINSAVLKGKEQPVIAMLLNGVLAFFITIVLLINFPINSAFQAMMYFSYAMGMALLCSILVFVVKLKKHLIISRTDYVEGIKNNFTAINTASRRLLLISLSALATQQLSVLILAKYVSLSVLGNFSLALKISVVMGYPLLVVNMITAPKYAKYFQQNKLIEFKKLAYSITRWLIVIATLSAVIIYFFIDDVMALFTQGYWQTAILVKILIIGQWFNLATGSVVSMLIMSGYEKLHQRNTLLITGLNIITLLVFIPYYGIFAAAIITSTFMAIKNCVALFFVNKLIYSKAIESV